MRVAVVAESFLPQVNGVTNSVLRVLEQLRAAHHDALVITNSAPGVPTECLGFEVQTVPSFGLPMYHQVRLATVATTELESRLDAFAPDVVHLGAPFALGRAAVLAAARLEIATVAVYQTDIASYLKLYGFGWGQGIVWRWLRHLHNTATLTLAPSQAARTQLLSHGIQRVELWGRGVDIDRFHPQRRDAALHRSWAPHGEVVVGYLGRLAGEKRLDDLAALNELPNVQLVLVGAGPRRHHLAAALPGAIFTGEQSGAAAGRYLASFDIFVHPGDLETFGQTIQEAQACGLPVVATAQGGPLDLVRPGQDGWLFAPGDRAGLRAAVAELATQPAQRAAFGTAGREKVSHLGWPRLCEQLFEYYRVARAAVRRADINQF